VDSIGYNIWDDYDDSELPVETHGYVEEFDVLAEEQKTEIGEIVLSAIMDLELVGVEVTSGGCEAGGLFFTGLTHDVRESVVGQLRGLTYNGTPIHVYSES
jgi:hypothetical protein